MNQKVLITFAGAVGSSKTPIAYYLSWKLNIPILNNDTMRTEVIEDLGFFDEQEYRIRRDHRISEVLKGGQSIIYDASIDREWKNWEGTIKKSGYEVFIISLDLSKDFLSELYTIKGYHESMARIDELFNDHEEFLKSYRHIVNLSIVDKDFKNRLDLTYSSVEDWLKE